jgi:hypothetical protein
METFQLNPLVSPTSHESEAKAEVFARDDVNVRAYGYERFHDFGRRASRPESDIFEVATWASLGGIILIRRPILAAFAKTARARIGARLDHFSIRT